MPRCCGKTAHVIPRSYSLGIFIRDYRGSELMSYDPHSKLILQKKMCLFSSLFGEMIQFDLRILFNWVGSTTNQKTILSKSKKTKNIIIQSSSTTQPSGYKQKTQMFCFGSNPLDPPLSVSGTWNKPPRSSRVPRHGIICHV